MVKRKVQRTKRANIDPTGFKNFDFGKNWHLVLPHLKTTEMQTEIFPEVYMSMVRDRNLPNAPYYDITKSPAEQISTYDSFATLLDTVFEHAREFRDAHIDPILWDSYEHHMSLDNDDDGSTFGKALNIQEQIMTILGFNFATSKDNISFYTPFGSCHWFNAVVSLHLANKLFPDQKWVVVKGHDHTTVACIESKRVFDLLYWGIDNRLEDCVLGKSYTSNDKSLGGVEAMETATKDGRYVIVK
jgi:hypothetical protein